MRPLADWCERAPSLPRREPPGRVLRRALRVQYLRRLPETVRTKGAGAAARQVARRVRRSLGGGRGAR